MANYDINITETLYTEETISSEVVINVNESATASDSHSYNVDLFINVNEEGTVSDTVVLSRIVSILVEESGSVSDSVSTNVDYLLTVQENAVGTVYLNTYKENSNGELEVENSFDCWVANNKTNAFSRYSDYNFTSFAYFNRKYYGANELGLYELDSDSEKHVLSKITTGQINFNQIITNPVQAHVYQKSNGSFALKVKTDKGIEAEYKMLAPNDPISSSRVVFGKGLIGMYFQFELDNQEASDFKIDKIDIIPKNTSRKN